MFSYQFLKSSFVAAALASVALGSHSATNLLINGDFEANIGDVALGGATSVVSGSSLITGWTVGGNSVDLILGNYGAITSVSVDLDGTPGPGTLGQTFAQVAGQTYTLVWDYFRNPPGSNLGVSFGGTPYTYTNVSSLTSPITESLTYTATFSGLGLVSFASSGGFGGPVIDNVSVTAVPEPEGVLLAVAGLALVFGARQRRKIR